MANDHRWLLKEWREHRGWSQTELGARAGYSQGQISQWEGGFNYTWQNIVDVATALFPNDNVRVATYKLQYVDPRFQESPLDVYEELDVRGQRYAMEMLKGLKRAELEHAGPVGLLEPPAKAKSENPG